MIAIGIGTIVHRQGFTDKYTEHKAVGFPFVFIALSIHVCMTGG